MKCGFSIGFVRAIQLSVTSKVTLVLGEMATLPGGWEGQPYRCHHTTLVAKISFISNSQFIEVSQSNSCHGYTYTELTDKGKIKKTPTCPRQTRVERITHIFYDPEGEQAAHIGSAKERKKINIYINKIGMEVEGGHSFLDIPCNHTQLKVDLSMNTTTLHYTTLHNVV